MDPRTHLTPRRIEVVILGLGVLLRARDFLVNRSLWLDEAMLARNVTDRSFAGLFQPLDHNQAAPVGFLVAQKAIVTTFGPSEWAFRLLPVAVGLWSLFLFARLSKQFFGPAAALRVLPLFAFSPHAYGATNKQYPVDLWAVLILLTLALRVTDAAARRRDFAALAAVGAGLVWVSHVVPLAAAAVGTSVIVGHARTGRWGRAGLGVAAAGCWLVSFAAVYFLFVRHLQGNNFLHNYWWVGFPPVGGGWDEFVAWAGAAVREAFTSPLRINPPQLGIALVAVGAVRLLRDPDRFGLFVLPIAVAFAAAVARTYPFQGRLILFLVPFFLWLLAAGLDGLAASRWGAVRAGGWAATLALCWQPALEAKRLLGPAARWEEPREVLQFVARHARPKDILYVHLSGRHTFEYYRGRIDLSGLDVVHGALVAPADAARQVLELPPGRRVWVFHSLLPDAACPVTPLTREELLAVAGKDRASLAQCDAPAVRVVLFGAVAGSPEVASDLVGVR